MVQGAGVDAVGAGLENEAPFPKLGKAAGEAAGVDDGAAARGADAKLEKEGRGLARLSVRDERGLGAMVLGEGANWLPCMLCLGRVSVKGGLATSVGLSAMTAGDAGLDVASPFCAAAATHGAP